MERICLLAIGLAVLTSTAARDLDFFEAAFGKNHHSYFNLPGTDKHELFAADQQRTAQKIAEQSSNVKPGIFLGCSESGDAIAAREFLQRDYGQKQVHTILSSEFVLEETVTCFLVHPLNSSIELFDAKPYLRVWLPVPTAVKLSSSAHSQLETLVSAAQNQRSQEQSAQLPLVMNQLKTSELAVHVGKASSHESIEDSGHHTRSGALAFSMAESLKTQSLAERSRSLLQLSAMMQHGRAWKTWQTVASQLKDASYTAEVWRKKHVRSGSRQLADEGASGGAGADCNFDKLVFSAQDEFIFITHMHELAAPACFASVLATVAQQPEVVSLSAEDRYVPLLDLVGDLLHSGDASEGRVYHDSGLNGSGVVVGLLDGGVDEYSCFFNNSDAVLCPRSVPGAPTHDFSRRKVIQYTYDEDSVEANANAHGTGMAGIICGESTTDTHPEHFGVAPGAKIALYDASTSSANVGPLDDNLGSYFDVAATTGAKVYSMSVGNRYTDYAARDVVNDQYAVDNDFLLIAAVGNYQAIANNLVFSPSRSKNALSVGSSGTSGDPDPNSLSYFSCTGPTADGRFGVDVLAHGVDVFAPRSSGLTAPSCELSSRTGTSSATAAVAGVAALVQEYFQSPIFWAASCNQDYSFCSAGEFVPKSILIKAVIIHSGQDVGNSLAYPGNEQGFGRVQLDQVLLYSGVTDTGLDLFVEEAVLRIGDVLNWTVAITADTIPLKVTVAWVDPANVVSAAKQLVNDVDLRVTDSSGAVTYGNNNSTGDAHNNVEMAFMVSPAPGLYVVSLHMKTLGTGSSQNVSLVITSHGTVGSAVTDVPTLQPSGEPSGEPTVVPSGEPSSQPSGEPSGEPTVVPSGEPSGQPTEAPTHQPNYNRYNRPSARPHFAYTVPTPAPHAPTSAPVLSPAASITEPPSNRAPTAKPTFTP